MKRFDPRSGKKVERSFPSSLPRERERERVGFIKLWNSDEPVREKEVR